MLVVHGIPLAIGESITVAVGSPDDIRSAIWRLWVQGDEVYFGARMLLATIKVSLHKSGKFRIAWVNKLNQKNDSGDRVMMRWPRPKPQNPGLTECLSVWVYSYPLKDPFRNKRIEYSGITWVTFPLFGRTLTLRVCIAARDADLDSNRFIGSKILGRIKKANGEIVLLLAHEVITTQALQQRMVIGKNLTKIHVRKGQAGKLDPSDISRTIIFTPPTAPLELPQIFDIGVDWENVVEDQN